MIQEIPLVIKPDYIQKYKDNYPLLSKESISELQNLDEEGSVLILEDSKKKFIAKA